MKITYLQYGLKIAKNLRDERNFIGKFSANRIHNRDFIFLHRKCKHSVSELIYLER